MLSFFVFTYTPQQGQVTSLVYQGEEIEEEALYLFFSLTCPHCAKEKIFLQSVIEKKYPDLTIYQYDVAYKENVVLMRELAKIHGVENMLGGVPLTFIGEYHIFGYGEDKTTGKDIENAIIATLGLSTSTPNTGLNLDTRKHFDVPFLGRIYAEDFSLPILAILLGFLDGFNVCSLGALVLIIGLTLKLQRRKPIILLGGTFILTTSLVYGVLIILWAKLFQIFGSQIDIVKILVALLAFGGGIYFFKEYFRMQKQGAVCEFSESKFINNLMKKTGKAFEDNTKLIGLLGVVLLFSAIISIVEFPCSAATPLVFAGLLSSAGLNTMTQIGYIALFVLFYMIDEIIIFGIAAYRLKLWMTSGTFTKYAVLAEGIILIIISFVFITPLIKTFLGW